MSSPGVRRWRVALVAALLVGGLFTLHVLTHHGEQVPSVAASDAALGHGHEEPAPAPADHDHDGVMTLCLAMLAGAAVTLLARAVRRPPTRPLALRRRAAAVAPLLLVGRAHGPPGRWSLSVCRC